MNDYLPSFRKVRTPEKVNVVEFVAGCLLAIFLTIAFAYVLS